jgi:hypothetical protein
MIFSTKYQKHYHFCHVNKHPVLAAMQDTNGEK